VIAKFTLIVIQLVEEQIREQKLSIS
jgi:hypothetical protein